MIVALEKSSLSVLYCMEVVECMSFGCISLPFFLTISPPSLSILILFPIVPIYISLCPTVHSFLFSFSTTTLYSSPFYPLTAPTSFPYSFLHLSLHRSIHPLFLPSLNVRTASTSSRTPNHPIFLSDSVFPIDLHSIRHCRMLTFQSMGILTRQ